MVASKVENGGRQEDLCMCDPTSALNQQTAEAGRPDLEGATTVLVCRDPVGERHHRLPPRC
jgi:hypothetical protein